MVFVKKCKKYVKNVKNKKCIKLLVTSIQKTTPNRLA